MDAKVPSLRRFVFGSEIQTSPGEGTPSGSQKIGEQTGVGETWIPFGSSQGRLSHREG